MYIFCMKLPYFLSPFLYSVITEGSEFQGLSLKFLISNFCLNSLGNTSFLFNKNLASATKSKKSNSTSNAPNFRKILYLNADL